MNLYQDLLERLKAAKSDEERAWITLQFNLNAQTESVREAVFAASVLNWFDLEMLIFVLETPFSEADFRVLNALPYVEEFPERGWNVHEKTRDLLRDKLWKGNKARYQKLSRRAAAWCRKRHLADSVWRAEAAYHALLAEERNAVQSFSSVGVTFLNSFQYAALETLTRSVLNAVRSNKLSGTAAAWAWYFNGRLDSLFSRDHEAKESFLRALNLDPGNHFISAIISESLGQVHSSLAELQSARQCVERSLSISRKIRDRQGEANCILELGNLSVRLSELPQARKYLNAALPLYRTLKDTLGEANSLMLKASIASAEGKSDEALAIFTDAMQRYVKMKAPPMQALCHNSIGIMFNNNQRYTEAIDAYSRAIEIFPIVNYFVNRAEPYMHLGNYSAAQRDLNSAIILNPNFAYLPFNKGRLALWQEQPKIALELFDQALMILPEYSEFHLWKALVLAINGAKWEDTLQAGLVRFPLLSQLQEVVAAIDKLAQIYSTVPTEALHNALQGSLVTQASRMGVPVGEIGLAQ